jgi:SAM-dependent methyltransferase
VGYLRRSFGETEALNRATILAIAAPRRGGVLLDIGCGDGQFTRVLGEHIGAGHLVGVERREDLADLAEACGVDVHRHDIEHGLPVADSSADVVVANQIIEHVAHTDGFMREIRRVLTPNGYAVVSTNNLSSLHNIASLAMGWQPMPAHVSDEVVGIGNPFDPHRGAPGSPGHMHLRLFTSRALRELAAHHGLALDEARGAGFYPFPPVVASFAARVAGRWAAYIVHRYRRG